MKRILPLLALLLSCLGTMHAGAIAPAPDTGIALRRSPGVQDFYLPIAQDSTMPGMEFRQFFYDNGQVSAEGYWKNGQPEGVWKNYTATGQLVSQGARKDLLLEGVWTFFEEGRISSQITYHRNLKNGLCRYFYPDRIISEYYRNDTLQGVRTLTDTSGRLLRSTCFENGLENGFDKRYNQYGEAYSFCFFRNGMVVFREEANQRDRQGRKQGLWKSYFDNGTTHWECTYLDDLKNGYHKIYDSLGNLLSIRKYVMGNLQEEAPELAELTVHTEYYANGMPKFRVGYRNGKPDGLCHQYDSITGKIIRGIFFNEGEIVSTGEVDETGNLKDNRIEYYPNGKIRCIGRYYKGKKTGNWKYFYPDGSIEQEGSYRNGLYEGAWTWYFPNGLVRMEQEYYQGKLDGPSIEYNEEGEVVAKGSYLDGLEEGQWEYFLDGERLEGSYTGGERDGVWKAYWPGKGKRARLSFKGAYVGGLEDGRHQHFNEEGKLVEEGFYRMGRRVGTWYKYDSNGLLEVSVTYDENEEEERYNGKRTLSKEEERNYRIEQGRQGSEP